MYKLFTLLFLFAGICCFQTANSQTVAGLNPGVTIIYPNPAANYADISYTSAVAGDFELKMFNMLGKQVFSQNYKGLSGANVTRINLQDLSSGVYMISISAGSSLITKRMVVSTK